MVLKSNRLVFYESWFREIRGCNDMISILNMKFSCFEFCLYGNMVLEV